MNVGREVFAQCCLAVNGRPAYWISLCGLALVENPQISPAGTDSFQHVFHSHSERGEEKRKEQKS